MNNYAKLVLMCTVKNEIEQRIHFSMPLTLLTIFLIFGSIANFELIRLTL